MTKANMIKEIQAKEADLWYQLAAYDRDHAPTDGDIDRLLCYDRDDHERCKILHAWGAVIDLMEAMGIPTDSDSWEHKYASEIRHDLFLKRQAARGIYYDERGNEINRAC